MFRYVMVADDNVRYVEPAEAVLRYVFEAVPEFKYVAVADESDRYVEPAVMVDR